MDVGEIVEIIIDDGDPIVNVPVTLAQEAHELLETRRLGDQWRLLVRRGPDV